MIADELRRVLIENGVDSVENQGLHGWRCQYPDRYPEPCGHLDELLAELVAVAEEHAKGVWAEDGFEPLPA